MSPHFQYRVGTRSGTACATGGQGTGAQAVFGGPWVRAWTYPSAPSSVPRCRRSVVTALRARGLTGDMLDSAALVVTELAGNAVEHADVPEGGGGTGEAAGEADPPDPAEALCVDAFGAGRPAAIPGGGRAATVADAGFPALAAGGLLVAPAIGEFTVVVGQRGGRVRIEVRDRGRSLPSSGRPDVPDFTATAGRGLFLVEALSARWGIRRELPGKSVWCELGC